MSPGTGAAGSSGYGRCSIDAHCGQVAVCVQGTCLPRPGSPPSPWAVEIRPSSNSIKAAFTEIVPAPTAATWRLSADAYVEVSATFTPFVSTPSGPGNGTALPGSANVLLELQSRIPGRPTLTFETTFPSGGTTATLKVPAGTRSRTGALTLIPLPPADQSSPPYRFSALVPADGSVLGETAPTGTTGTTTTSFELPANNLVQGLLQDVFGQPKVAYTARAYLGGTQVSSSAVMQMDGKFQLLVPSTVSGEIVVELAPQSGLDPWFTYNKRAFAGSNLDLGTVMLPAYQVPSQNPPGFVFHVESDEAIPSFVGNAAIRAFTVLANMPSDPLGVTRFWRNGTTNMAGDVELSLIPGMNQAARTYDVSVVPPPGSPFAATCAQEQVLGSTGVSTIALSHRRRLTGNVTSALGTPVEGVTVVASRDPAGARVCTASGPTSFTEHTDENGYYQLYLDPGVYRVDYDPPGGSAAPRLTEPHVDVTADVALPIQLPAAALIEGDVFDSDEVTPLPNATIRILRALRPGRVHGSAPVARRDADRPPGPFPGGRGGPGQHLSPGPGLDYDGGGPYVDPPPPRPPDRAVRRRRVARGRVRPHRVGSADRRRRRRGYERHGRQRRRGQRRR